MSRTSASRVHGPTSLCGEPRRRRQARGGVVIPSVRVSAVAGAIVFALGSILSGGSTLAAQSPPGLQLREVVRIGGRLSDAYSLDLASNVRPWKDGYILSRAIGARAAILVASPEGELTRVVAREGDGPGEFRTIHNIGTYGDSLLVYAPGVVTVLTPELEYARQTRIAGAVFDLEGNAFGHLFTGGYRYGEGVANVWFQSPEGDLRFVLDEAVDSPDGDVNSSNFRAVALAADTIFVVTRDGTELHAFAAQDGRALYTTDVPLPGPVEVGVDLSVEDGVCSALFHTNDVPLADLEEGEEFEMRKVRDSVIVRFGCRTGEPLGVYEGTEGLLGLLPGRRAAELVLHEATGERVMVIYTIEGGA